MQSNQRSPRTFLPVSGCEQRLWRALWSLWCLKAARLALQKLKLMLVLHWSFWVRMAERRMSGSCFCESAARCRGLAKPVKDPGEGALEESHAIQTHSNHLPPFLPTVSQPVTVGLGARNTVLCGRTPIKWGYESGKWHVRFFASYKIWEDQFILQADMAQGSVRDGT